MDFTPILNELAKNSPSRDIIIDELDVLTDFLRAGYPTTTIIDDLFNVFTKLIHFSQWHIQQDTLSCTKYIFENSTLSSEQKKEFLLKHIDFTKHLGELLSDPKREVREMSSQCIGHLALHVGPSIIDPEFQIKPFIFEPAKTAFALEGQQMALGRLATSFRIESPESLKIILPLIINCEQFSTITNPSDNGYIFWYSTRALLLFVLSKCDPVLSKYQKQFEQSHEFVMQNFKDQIKSSAYSRLSHPYANVRRTAAQVVTAVFSSSQTEREKFIDSLLPTSDMKWVAREGLFAAIGGCLSSCKTPLDSNYIESLCQKLSDFVKDPIACDDKTPVTQKGNANGMAGKALVQVLRQHDPSLFEKYVKPIVQYLLESPIAALIDAGVISLSELQNMNNANDKLQFNLKDLYLQAFKNICHASFPICDLARRTIPAAKVVQESFNELVGVLVKFGSSVDPEVRESVCKSIQMVSGMTTEQLPQSVINLAENLAKDQNESVAASALDVLRCALDAKNVAKVPQIVKNALSGDSDDAICAAIRLLKSSLILYRNAVIDDIYSISPLLAFHTLSSMTPSVSTSAQQLLVMIAGNDQETDDNLVDEVSEFDFDSIDVSELEETVEKCVSNKKAPTSMLKVIVNRYCDNLGKSAQEIIQDFKDQDSSSIQELIEYVCGEEKADVIAKLTILLTKAGELSKDQVEKVMQVLADTFADEAIDVEDKQPLLVALDEMRKLPLFSGENRINIPDPTPISLSHHTETFAKNQSA